MKIQLKRSSVLDGGSAKKPLPDQMEYGELAINYNADDPTIFLKTSANQIVAVAGSSSSGGDGTGNLQQVTDNGSFTTNSLLVGGTLSSPTIQINNTGTIVTEGFYRSTGVSSDPAFEAFDGSVSAKIFANGNAAFGGTITTSVAQPSTNIFLNAATGEITAKSATVAGAINTSGKITGSDGLTITGDSIFRNDLAITEDLSVTGNLNVIEDTTLNTLTVLSNATVGGTLAVTGLVSSSATIDGSSPTNALVTKGYVTDLVNSSSANDQTYLRLDGTNSPMTGHLGLPGGGGATDALQKQEIQQLIAASGGGGDTSNFVKIGDNISELVNNVGYLTVGTASNSFILINDGGIGQSIGPSGLSLNNGSIQTIVFGADGSGSFTGSVVSNGVVVATGMGVTNGSNQTITLASNGDISNDGAINGVKIWQGNPVNGALDGGHNIAIGDESLFNTNNTTAYNNIAIGEGAQNKNQSGASNTAVGRNALRENTIGSENTVSGAGAVRLSTSPQRNVAIGTYALRGRSDVSNNTVVGTIYDCTAVGYGALRSFVPVIGNPSDSQNLDRVNTAVGNLALAETTNGHANTAVGYRTLTSNTTGQKNTAVGHQALFSGQTAESCVAIGSRALYAETNGTNNVAVGKNSLQSSNGINSTVAIGTGAFSNLPSGSNNTALGQSAGSGLGTTLSNITCLGANANVSGSNQVQLGDSATTTYAYGSVQNRSDERDKTDIRDTVLGLDFIKALRPVDFRWNYREDYNAEIQAGTRARTRFHQGLIAQEVKATADAQGVDFGGYQDHSIKGGDDVLTIGYSEMIAPLIKAVQQLSAENEELKSRIQALE